MELVSKKAPWECLLVTFVSLICYYTNFSSLNLSTWFKKKVLFEHEKVNQLSKRHFMENQAEIMHHVLKMQYIFCWQNIEIEFLWMISYV